MTTPRFAHGLVIGKFYPPHVGHDHLVATAAARCDRVTVVVAGSSQESLTVRQRVEWLAATHTGSPNVRVVGDLDDEPVDYGSPAAWEAHVAIFAAAVARAAIADGLEPAGAVVDAVFSSEGYGTELARRFGATHVLVDRDRTAFPVSGTAVRADVVGRWSDLAPSVRAGLALRVVVVGAESTGTTTLAGDLAEHLRGRGGPWADVRCVPEFGREYTDLKRDALRHQEKAAGTGREVTQYDLTWTPGDFVAIAARQRDLEDAAAPAAPVLVCDTDAFATSVWLTRYLGDGPDVRPWRAEVDEIADSREHALYLLTDHDGVEYEQDGTRDGEHVRPAMTGWFVDALDSTGRTWVRMTGSRSERLTAAAAAVQDLMGSAWHLAAPKTETGAH